MTSHSELDRRMVIGRRQCESTQPQAISGLASVASMPDSDFVELVWENGQIGVRGMSSNTRRIARDWDDFYTKKAARYDRHKLSLHDANRAELLAEPHETNLNAVFTDATTINTINCHDHDKQQQRRHIGILNAKRGITFKSVNGEEEEQRAIPSELCQSSMQPHQASVPFVRSHGLDSICGRNTISPHLPVTNFGSLGLKLQTTLPDPGTNDMKIGLMNFSHFVKPAALVQASIQYQGAKRHTNIQGLSRIEKLEINKKRSGANTSYTAEPTPVEPATTVSELISSSKAKPQKELLFPDKHYEAVCQEDFSRRKGSIGQVLRPASSLLTASAAAHQGKTDTERFMEPMIATSSVCSHGASNDPTCYLKRKYQGDEESEYLSEDAEEYHEGFAKTVHVQAKRRRTAQVHNLSERRRRDKINKKMRVLRELIPNCNKVDKASMLDEAIEYLKTLQFQAQIMSIACMPPMMLPTGIQQIYAPHLPHITPVVAGMGMGMGMGMDMGVGCNQLQFPTSISGATSLPGIITGTRFQMMGIPGQVLPMSLSHANFTPLPGGPSAQSVQLGNVFGSCSKVEHPTLVPTSSSNNPIQNINFEINC